MYEMRDAIEMYNKYGDETLYPLDFMYTDVEIAIKEAIRKKDTKIDLDLFYDLIEFASEIEHDRDEDDHLNKSWEKAINNYLKKFYPKEKYYYLFPYENL